MKRAACLLAVAVLLPTGCTRSPETVAPEPAPIAAVEIVATPELETELPAPDPDAITFALSSECPNPWTGIVLEDGSPSSDVAVGDDDYFAIEPGQSQELTMHPGDVLWLRSSTGGSVPIDFDSKDDALGVRLVVAQDCSGIRTIRTVGG